MENAHGKYRSFEVGTRLSITLSRSNSFFTPLSKWILPSLLGQLQFQCNHHQTRRRNRNARINNSAENSAAPFAFQWISDGS